MHRYMFWLLVWVPDATRTRSRWTWQTAVVLTVLPLDGKEGCKLLDWPTSRPVSLVILLWCPLWLVSTSNSQSHRSTELIIPSSLSDRSTWPYWAIQLSSSADSIPGKSPKHGCYLGHFFYLLNKNMGKHLKKKQTNKYTFGSRCILSGGVIFLFAQNRFAKHFFRWFIIHLTLSTSMGCFQSKKFSWLFLFLLNLKYPNMTVLSFHSKIKHTIQKKKKNKKKALPLQTSMHKQGQFLKACTKWC